MEFGARRGRSPRERREIIPTRSTSSFAGSVTRDNEYKKRSHLTATEVHGIPVREHQESIRKGRTRAINLIADHSGEYAARSAPEWVVKCIMSIDKHQWGMGQKMAGLAEEVQQNLEQVQLEAEDDLRHANLQIERMKEELTEERYQRIQAEEARNETMREMRRLEDELQTSQTLTVQSRSEVENLKRELLESKTLAFRLQAELEHRRQNVKNEIREMTSLLRTTRMTTPSLSLPAPIAPMQAWTTHTYATPIPPPE